MIKTTDIVINNDCIGKLLLLAVRPDTKDDSDMFRYNVLAPKLGYEKFTIRIAGRQQMDVPEGTDAIEVCFDNLVLRPYVIDGKFGLTGTAKAIRRVTTKA